MNARACNYNTIRMKRYGTKLYLDSRALDNARESDFPSKIGIIFSWQYNIIAYKISR